MAVLVGQKAPAFKAKAVTEGTKIVDDFSLEQYLGEKYVIFFFYPKDFTFVCPTELIRFQEELAEFESRDVAVVGCSTDSEFSHFAWLNMPKNQGGIQKTIAEDYDVLAGRYGQNEFGGVEVEGELVAYRGLFLIDKEGTVQHQVVNNMPLGRSIREALRMVDALQHFEKHGEVCPMDWDKGAEAMTPDQKGVSDYLSSN